MKRVVHYYPRALSDRSGVTAAIRLWEAAAARSGYETTLLHASKGEAGHVVHSGGRRPTFIPWGLGKRLRSDDLLVLHEGWTLSNVFAAAVARRRRIPYVTMPHGVYEPGVMRGLR